MKRLLSCFLCIMILMQSIAVVAQDTKDVSENKEFAGMAYVLNKFGIVESAENTDFEKTVTRAEFATFVNNILKYSADKNDMYFVDVTASHWAKDSINALVPSGIISYAQDGRFNPDNIITYEQMCKMLVFALGYGDFADTSKGGMGVYINLAEDLGFGIKMEKPDTATLEDVVEIIYKAMQVPLSDIRVTSNGVVKVDRDNDTLFSVYYDAYVEKGTINAYFGASLSDFVAKENEVLINDTVVSLDAGFSPYGLLGEYCEIVYTEFGEEITLIYATPTRDEVVKINAQDVESFDAATNTVKYYDGTKEKKFSFSNETNIVFNGRLYAGDVSSKFSEFINGSRVGEIRYVDPATEYAKEVLEITSYEVYIAGKYDENTEVFYEYFDNTNKFAADEFNSIVIKNSNGETGLMPKVFPAPMLVGTSADKEYLNIMVCNRTEDITITGIDEGEYEIFVSDGRAIKVLASVYPDLKLSVGKSYSVTYDAFGNIIFAIEKTVASQDMKLGYLRYIKKRDGDAEEEYHIGVYAEDKAFHDYKLAQRVQIDGYIYKNSEVKKWLIAIPGNTVVKEDNISIERQIIRYTLNASEEIAKIDTYNCTDKENPENTLTRIADQSQSLCWNGTPSSFGMKVYVTGDHTKQFIVPAVDENGNVNVNGEIVAESADLYSDSFSFRDWTYYNIEAYKYDPDMLQAEVVVCYADPIKESIDFIMFENTSKRVDKDGEVVNVLNGVSNGAEFSMPVSEGCFEVTKTLNKGDIICVDTNFFGDTIYKITKAFDVKTKTFEPYGAFTNRDRNWYAADETGNDSSKWRGPSRQMTKSFAYDQKNVAISSSYTLGDAKDGNIQIVSRSQGMGVGIYDSKAEKDMVFAGAVTDINTYKATGEDCDMILICSNYARVKQIFVYR